MINDRFSSVDPQSVCFVCMVAQPMRMSQDNFVSTNHNVIVYNGDAILAQSDLL